MRGDGEEAFERLAERYAGDIHRLAAAIVGTVDAGDVTQEVLLLACRKLPSLHDPDRAAAWIRRIVINRCTRTASSTYDAVADVSTVESSSSSNVDVIVMDDPTNLPNIVAWTECADGATTGGTDPNAWCRPPWLRYDLSDTAAYDTLGERNSIACRRWATRSACATPRAPRRACTRTGPRRPVWSSMTRTSSTRTTEKVEVGT